MKRRSITLGKEQVAELLVRLDKIPGLVESLMDHSIIPSREDVHMATTDRRDQKLRIQTVVLDKKRRRITELEDELGTSGLPERKRMRTENSLSTARTHLRASEACRVVILSKGQGILSGQETKKGDTESHGHEGTVAILSPEGCIMSFSSPHGCPGALEWYHHNRRSLLFVAPDQTHSDPPQEEDDKDKTPKDERERGCRDHLTCFTGSRCSPGATQGLWHT
jgi:hypothetical protein